MKLFPTLLCAAVFALPAFAAEKPAKKADAKPAAAAETKPAAAPATGTKPFPMNSRADEIDAAAKSFVQINKEGKRAKHTLGANAEVKQGDAAASFGDIKVGDYVSGLRIKKADGEYEIVKITKFGPKAEKKAADTAKPAAEGEKKADKK